MGIGIRLPNVSGMSQADINSAVATAIAPLQQQVTTATTTAQGAQTTAATTQADVNTLIANAAADRAQLNTRVAALEAKTWQVQRQTVSTPAALAIGATVDLTVTWSPAMPDLNYLASVTPDATGVLLSDIVAVKSKSTTTVVITVKALVALTAGVKVVVEAGRWG